MHHTSAPAKPAYNRTMRWLSLFVLLLSAPAVAADGVEVDDAQTQALVDSIRGRPLSLQQHDLLVELGEQADGATPGDRLYVGWALVFADRPDLGMPLVRRGLSEVRLDASSALRTLIFAETAGQDGLVRATLAVLKLQSPEGAQRLRNSVRKPDSFAVAQRKARGPLKGLESGEVEVPFEAGDARRLVWFVRPTEPTAATVIWLPDGGLAEGLPPTCQDAAALKEAAALARAGHSVYLPGLRGCDGSDGAYSGSADAIRDLNAMLPLVRAAEPGRDVILLGLQEGALLAVRVADSVDVDAVAAWQPSDPGDVFHLPDAVIAARDVSSRPSRRMHVALPHPALAQILGQTAVELVPLPRARRVDRALETLQAVTSAPAVEDR
jgi:hypothetical protein